MGCEAERLEPATAIPERKSLKACRRARTVWRHVATVAMTVAADECPGPFRGLLALRRDEVGPAGQ